MSQDPVETSKLAKAFELLGVAADTLANLVKIPPYLAWAVIIWCAILIMYIGVMTVEKFLSWIRWFLFFSGVMLFGAIILILEIIK